MESRGALATGRKHIRKGGRGRTGDASRVWRGSIALGGVNSGGGGKEVGTKVWGKIESNCFDPGTVPGNESYAGLVEDCSAELFDPFLEGSGG